MPLELRGGGALPGGVMRDPEARAITLTTDGAQVRLVGTWPEVTLFAETLLRAEPEVCQYQDPFVTLRVANAQAVYRVEPREAGVLIGRLVESWMEA